MGFDDLVNGFVSFVFEFILLLFSPIIITCCIGLIVFGTICGIYYLLAFRIFVPIFSASKARPKREQVRLKDSPLFLACLQKIADGDVHTLYINSHMLCVNFSGSLVPESQVLEFSKFGYEAIDEHRVKQYAAQLITAAKRLPNVASVDCESRTLNNSCLVFDGTYGDGYAENVLTIHYQVASNANLHSFNTKEYHK